MKPMQIHSTKYDGSLHYRYEVSVISSDHDLLMVYCRPGTQIQSYRGSLLAGRHSLGLYWLDRPYNLTINWTSTWNPHSHYINVATPARWDDGVLRFVDLDLDVIWKTDGTVILDDEDEFEWHRERFGYPPDLVADSWRSRDEVVRLIERSVHPFDGSLYRWRPHGSA